MKSNATKIVKFKQNITPYKCHALCDKIRELPKKDWQHIEINFKEYKVTSLPFTQIFKTLNIV